MKSLLYGCSANQPNKLTDISCTSFFKLGALWWINWGGALLLDKVEVLWACSRVERSVWLMISFHELEHSFCGVSQMPGQHLFPTPITSLKDAQTEMCQQKKWVLNKKGLPSKSGHERMVKLYGIQHNLAQCYGSTLSWSNICSSLSIFQLPVRRLRCTLQSDMLASGRKNIFILMRWLRLGKCAAAIPTTKTAKKSRNNVTLQFFFFETITTSNNNIHIFYQNFKAFKPWRLHRGRMWDLPQAAEMTIQNDCMASCCFSLTRRTYMVMPSISIQRNEDRRK